MTKIETHGLRREYGTLVAVESADLRVQGGQVVGLIGPNGAGKTTLLRMLATLLLPTDGELRISGLDARVDFLKIRRRMGFLPDFFNLYNDLTPLETLAFFADAHGVARGDIASRADRALRTVDLMEKAHERVRHLSRGMTQRLGLAALLVRDPEVLLLDEPASGLDPLARVQLRDILKRLRAEGCAVIVSSHILPELEGFCTDLIVMDRGRIVVSGSVADMTRQKLGGRAFAICVKGNAESAKQTLERIPGARVTMEGDGELLAEVDDARFDETDMVRVLVQAGVSVSRFCERRRGIEDLFMQISGRAAGAADEGCEKESR